MFAAYGLSYNLASVAGVHGEGSNTFFSCNAFSLVMRQYVTNPHNESQFIPNVPLRPLVTKHSHQSSLVWYFQKNWFGMRPPPKTFTLLMTKDCDISTLVMT